MIPEAKIKSLARNQGVDPAVIDRDHALGVVLWALSSQGMPGWVFKGGTCLRKCHFGDYRFSVPLRIGDEVRFADAAGYTMVKTSWFNGLRMPSIVVRRLDGTVETVRQFTYDDFERSLS